MPTELVRRMAEGALETTRLVVEARVEAKVVEVALVEVVLPVTVREPTIVEEA